MRAPLPGQIIVYRQASNVRFAQVFETYSESLHAKPWLHDKKCWSEHLERFAHDEIFEVLPATIAPDFLATNLKALHDRRSAELKHAHQLFEKRLAKLLKRRTV